MIGTGYRIKGLQLVLWLPLALGGTLTSRGDEPIAEAGGKHARELESLSLEELLDIEVTSVSKKEQKLSESAAAIYVITQEDIRRSGMRSIPELLRMVPGMDVAQIDSNKWAISSRGFNGRFANKLLVLIDGRSVYSSLFSGVYWDIQDTMLEDVERIEVIRGPGATLWGVNAVNGVINVITKKAADTQGLLISGGGGSEDLAFGAIRYGASFGSRSEAHFRVYGKYALHDDFVERSGHDAADEWDTIRGGFRFDWQVAPSDLVTVQGDIYAGTVGSTLTLALVDPPFSETVHDSAPVAGGNALVRWTHTISATSDTVLQAYYDRTQRNDILLGQIHDTFDVDFQHRFAVADWNELIWGIEYRAVLDHLDNGPTITAQPSHRGVDWISGFIQDEARLFEDSLRLTLGTKLGYDDFGGFNVQPSGRAAWIPNDRHTVWAAASRAVRTPSRAEQDIRINLSADPSGVVALMGNHGFESENVTALELGYRVHPVETLSVDVAGFYNMYDHLLTLTSKAPFAESTPPPPHLVFPQDFDNNMDGETYGIEIASTLVVTDWWKVSGGYTFLRMFLHEHGTSSGSEDPEGQSPRNQVNVRSFMDLPGNLQLDLLLFYADRLPNYDIPSYVRLDARLGWHPTKNVEISVGVQNALDAQHPELGDELFTKSSEIERGFYGRIVVQF